MVGMESLLGEEQVSSSHTSLTVQKRLIFWSDRWITPDFFPQFLDVIFLVVDMESLLCEVKVRSRHTRITTQKGSNFWSDRWIVLKFLQ
jgi:hypothetical protein